jgi:hypothetical protein
MKLTRTERLAMNLFAVDLTVPEVAAAMNWTVPETQTFRNRLTAMLRRSAPVGQRSRLPVGLRSNAISSTPR